jgi:glycosyltransferase involved in cell wall biosynthesis
MKSVWLIHNNIPPYRVPLFAEIAKSGGYDFTVVLTAPKCKHRPYWRLEGETMPFKVRVMKGVNIALSDDASVSVSLGLLPSLVWNKPDVVICNGFGISTLIVFVYCNIFRKKYVVWSEATVITEQHHGVRGLRKWLRKLVARHAHAFIDAGTLAREYIRSLLPANPETPFFRSYNCIDSSVFSSNPANPSDIQETSATFPKLLFVGRLNERKGVPMLLEVYRDVLGKTAGPVGLMLVGEGPLRPLVEQCVRDVPSARVELHGQIHHRDVALYYNECSVFVLLSLWDCNPLVLFEALHAGVPIVCTNCAGNAVDFIREGENGYIVDPTDKAQVVTAVLDILSWDSTKRTYCRRVSLEQAAKANYRDSAMAFVGACDAVLPRRRLRCSS